MQSGLETQSLIGRHLIHQTCVQSFVNNPDMPQVPCHLRPQPSPQTKKESRSFSLTPDHTWHNVLQMEIHVNEATAQTTCQKDTRNAYQTYTVLLPNT